MYVPNTLTTPNRSCTPLDACAFVPVQNSAVERSVPTSMVHSSVPTSMVHSSVSEPTMVCRTGGVGVQSVTLQLDCCT